ncbi:molybdate ABC transporter substrate-binding protein [Demequina salsinemoris]|uniref:molybdate ABC transporter substrate-binding protein n=1 Tax=Demequina salsinemoris TaxID=577470 RepID=UPI0007818CF6|nr:molybdate ABC transporter substrate-binding protein [Demequina salsinemoris]
MQARVGAVATVGLVALGLTACAAPDDESEDQTLTVLAAASLTDVFTEIAADFEETHPHVHVQLSFAGSSTLAQQVLEGAPADVIATANEATMALVADELDIEPHVFATNVLTIVVAEGNPAGIDELSDLTDDDTRLVICAPQVPCGAATALVAEAAGVELSPVSEEANVTDVLGKVASGEADAGIVYVTDIARAEGVEAVALPDAEAGVNLYPIAALPDGSGAEEVTADAFVAAVLSDASEQTLAAAGFGTP